MHEVEHGLKTWKCETKKLTSYFASQAVFAGIFCRSEKVAWEQANSYLESCDSVSYQPLSSFCVLAVVGVSCAISTDPTCPVTLIPLLGNTSTVE